MIYDRIDIIIIIDVTTPRRLDANIIMTANIATISTIVMSATISMIAALVAIVTIHRGADY